MKFTNAKVAKILQDVAVAYTLKRADLFQIRAYETAATAIEHSTSEIKDIWEEGKLDQIPGIGESLANHLDELFRTGKVKHWETVKKGIPDEVFDFINIPGVGPKTALNLSKLGAASLEDLKHQLKSGALVKRGLSEKMAQKLLASIDQEEAVKSGRMLLPYAFTQAKKVLDYLGRKPEIERADVLGSLRRMVATIGDLDFAISSKNPKKAVESIISLPGVARVVDKGEAKVTLIMNSGLQLDFLIVEPNSYGALLQHFTGSLQHNIHLRTIAERKGFSLSEYGVKDIKTGKIKPTATEEEFYELLKMNIPPPELREDTGEIEAALRRAQGKPGGLPKLIELEDIKGDLHIHDNFPIESSHDLGQNSLGELAKKAQKLGYEYIGIADHSPSVSNHSPDQIIKLIEKHAKYIEQFNSSHKHIRVLNLLEVDIQPDGSLSVPDKGLRLLDFAIASVHSVHHMDKEKMTKRILKALENPYVKILGHPTNRLINQRDSSEADWEGIFKYAAKNQKALEINAFFNRLDLPDNLVRIAKDYGVKFVIGTDSHEVESMENMRFGVAVARRGWATKDDILNSWDWTKFARWFKINL